MPKNKKIAPKPYFRAIYPISRLFFSYFLGEAVSYIFPTFSPISGRRPETYSVAGQAYKAETRPSAIAEYDPLCIQGIPTIFFRWFMDLLKLHVKLDAQREIIRAPSKILTDMKYFRITVPLEISADRLKCF